MSFNYTPDFTLERDQIRLAIGDTVDHGDYSLSDEEIAHILSYSGNVVNGYSAAACARALAGKMAFLADSRNDELEIDASQRFSQLMKLADRLERNPDLFTGKSLPTPTPFFGGVERAENEALENDSSTYQQWFKHGRFDHPGSSAGGPLAEDVGTVNTEDPIVNPDTVYWGVAAAGGSGEAFVLALSGSVVSATRIRSFAVTAGGSEKIYYAYPEDFGEATFTVGALPGGFSLTETLTVDGRSYYLYESDNLGLGSVTVSVT